MTTIDHSEAEALRRLDAAASTLLPGNDTWPDAGGLGLAERMLARASNATRFRAALAAFLELPDPDLGAGSGPEERHAAMTRLQAQDPELFGLLLTIVYDAYYTHPEVLALVSARAGMRPGPPQPRGHALPLELTRDPRKVREAGLRWRDDQEPIARTVRAAQEADPHRVWNEEEIAAWSR